MVLRGLAAIVSGLVIGAIVGILPVAIRSNALPTTESPLSVLVAIGAGIVLTIPGWGLGCAIVLPLVTHRMQRGTSVAPLPYYGLAAGIGAIGVLPTYILLAASDPSVLAVMMPAGIAGGVTIAALWRLLILKPIAARRAPTHGAYLG